MRIIQPCCATKQFMMLRDAIGNNGATQFQGFGDLSLTELLPAMLTRYAETEMMIIAPALPDQSAEIIGRWMRRQMARMDGKGKLNYISKLTIIADLSPEQSPIASGWAENNPFAGRLELINKAQEETALLLPDIAVTGPLNMRYGREFTCSVTSVPENVRKLWKQYERIAKAAKRSALKKSAPTKGPERFAEGSEASETPVSTETTEYPVD